MLALALLSLGLPDIALDTGFADAVVRISDTAAWTQLPYLCVVALIVLISRACLSNRRRMLEAGIVVAAMLIVLVGNALINENITKPIFGIARPNIVALTESGALGADIPDADVFYAIGDKAARRLVLKERLPTVQEPALTERVRAHWIHETGYAFPSGHSTAAVTFACMFAAQGLLWLGGWRRRVTMVVLPIWAVCVVYSRILLGVHTPVDVVAGTLIGFCWGLLAFGAIRRLSTRFAGDRATSSSR
jgi:phosphatidylglycerophosphatase B